MRHFENSKNISHKLKKSLKSLFTITNRSNSCNQCETLFKAIFINVYWKTAAVNNNGQKTSVIAHYDPSLQVPSNC